MQKASHEALQFYSSFLSERGDPSAKISPSHDERVANAEIEVLSLLERHPSSLASSLISEIERGLRSAPDQETLSRIAWPRFFEGAERESSKPLEIFGVNVLDGIQSIPFSLAITPLISLAVKHYLNDCQPFFANNVPVAQALAKCICLQLAELSCFALYVMFSERIGMPVETISPARNAELYAEFCKDIKESGWEPVITRFPVLGRLIHQRIEHTCSSFSRFVKRLNSDLEDIVQRFDLPTTYRFDAAGPALPLAEIALGLSDPHNNGATVYRLRFSSGRRLIYKPKAIENEYWFHDQLLLGARAEGVMLPYLRTLPRDGYGWVEDISDPITVRPNLSEYTDEELIGCAAAVAYLLSASDLHCENVLIQDRAIYFIDLETLFYSPTFIVGANAEGSGEATAGLGVIETGLFRESASMDPESREPSGLFDTEVPQTFPVPQFVIGDQGELLLTEGQEQRPGSEVKRECFNLSIVNPAKIAKYFRNSVESLTRHGTIARLLSRADKTKTRLILRPTAFYFRLWHRMLQPRFLTDGALFSLELYKLFEDCVQLGESAAAYIGTIIKSEILQIQNGDVPLFWADFHSRTISSTGGDVQQNYLFRSPRDEAVRKLGCLKTPIIEENARLLEAALYVAQDIEASTKSSLPIVRRPLSPALDKMILTKTKELALSLGENVFLSASGHSAWVSYFGAVDGKRLFPNAQDPSFYGGYVGVLTFLGVASNELRRHGEDTDALAEFLASEKRKLEYLVRTSELKHLFLPRGAELGLSGAGGILLAAARCGTADSELVAPLVEWVLGAGFEVILTAIGNDKSLDMINGSAGLLLGASAFARRHITEPHSNNYSGLSILVEAGLQRLVDVASNGTGIAPWLISANDEELVGFSHGGFGFAAALSLGAQLSKQLGSRNPGLESRAVSLVEHVIARCNTHRDPVSMLWFDNRSRRAPGSILNNTWCHGLAGVGYAYLMCLSVGKKYEDTIELLVSKLAGSERSTFDCFCCGEAGVIDFLMTLASNSDIPGLNQCVEQRLSTVFSDWYASGQYQGIWGPTNPVHSPGLFQGSTGIAYTGLRFLNPVLGSLGAELSA